MPTLRPPVGGNEKVQAEGGLQSNAWGRAHAFFKEHLMAYVRVEQRNARLAAAVRVETVQGKEGPLSKGTVVVISNVRKGSGEGREEEATSIQWTLWGKQADNAAAYLGKGSRVNVLGRLQNNNYQNADGQQVYGMTFTVEDIDYLDTKADADARKAREVGNTPPEASGVAPVKGSGRTRAGARTARAMATTADEDVPF
jgi:single stranded DNA-binding protein